MKPILVDSKLVGRYDGNRYSVQAGFVKRFDGDDLLVVHLTDLQNGCILSKFTDRKSVRSTDLYGEGYDFPDLA